MNIELNLTSQNPKAHVFYEAKQAQMINACIVDEYFYCKYTKGSVVLNIHHMQWTSFQRERDPICCLINPIIMNIPVFHIQIFTWQIGPRLCAEPYAIHWLSDLSSAVLSGDVTEQLLKTCVRRTHWQSWIHYQDLTQYFAYRKDFTLKPLWRREKHQKERHLALSVLHISAVDLLQFDVHLSGHLATKTSLIRDRRPAECWQGTVNMMDLSRCRRHWSNPTVIQPSSSIYLSLDHASQGRAVNFPVIPAKHLVCFMQTAIYMSMLYAFNMYICWQYTILKHYSSRLYIYLYVI